MVRSRSSSLLQPLIDPGAAEPPAITDLAAGDLSGRRLQAHGHGVNAQSWESLIARLRPEWSARELSDQFLWKEGLNATPEDTWIKMQGPHGLWVIYQNARVMLEMADYATRNSDNFDRVLLETLRSDAMQIRVCVLMALAQYAFNHASEGVRVNAFHAASMYTGMAARMTQLLQENAAVMVPDFVAAM